MFNSNKGEMGSRRHRSSEGQSWSLHLHQQ